MKYDDVVDIQLVGNEIIQVKRVSFDIDKIERAIKKMPYRGQGLVKDDRVENSKLPSIVKEFYKIIFLRSLPTAEKLFEVYFDNHFVDIDGVNCRYEKSGEVYSKEGVRARVFRAYPSLLRDFHFYVLCHSSGLFEKVRYSFVTDAYDGIDLMVTFGGEDYGVSLFVMTKRSQGFKKKKYKRHNYENLKEVCIEINPFDKSNYVGDYAVYGKEHLEYLVKKIREFENNKAI